MVNEPWWVCGVIDQEELNMPDAWDIYGPFVSKDKAMEEREKLKRHYGMPHYVGSPFQSKGSSQNKCNKSGRVRPHGVIPIPVEGEPFNGEGRHFIRSHFPA